MLAFFRNTLGSKIAMGILALVVMAFILAGVFTRQMPGISSLGGGSGGATIAQVGDHTITAPEMSDRVRQQLGQYAQQQPGLEMPTFVAQGGYDAVVDQTIGAMALEGLGRSIGIVASKKLVDGEIAGEQAFLGPDGKFNHDTYLAVLQQQHISEKKLRDDIAGDIIRRSLYLPATGAIKLADGLVKPYASLLIEQRYGTIGLIPVEAMAGGAAPTDGKLQTFYKQHIAIYTTPERRVLRYAMIGRDQVAASAIPAEAAIRKVYDANPQKYAARETRDLSQVVLDSHAKAQAFKAVVNSGKSFAEAASAIGFADKDIALGEKSQAEYAQFAAPAVAAAAFALPSGGVSDPVKSDFGWHVIKVNGIKKIPATPYEVARAQIAGDLGKALQDKALGTLLNKAQDALEAGQNFDAVARINGLTVTETPPITQAGAAPDQPSYMPPAEVRPLLKAGFASRPDLPPTIEAVQAGERYALLGVARILPAAPIPFADVKTRLGADFLAVRNSERARAIGAALEAKVDGGTPMAAAFASAPVKLAPPQQGQARRIDLSRAQNVPETLTTLFKLPPGHSKLVPIEGGKGWALVRLDKIVPGDPKLLPQLIAATRGPITQSAADEYVQQLSAAAGNVVGVTRNPTAIAQLKMQLLRGEAPATSGQ